MFYLYYLTQNTEMHLILYCSSCLVIMETNYVLKLGTLTSCSCLTDNL
jgi:hypothetical protein